jgi:hypothetical protein
MDKTNKTSLSVDDYISLREVYEFLRNSQNELLQAQYSQDKLKKTKNKPATNIHYLGVYFPKKRKASLLFFM